MNEQDNSIELEMGIQSEVLRKNPIFNAAIEELRKDLYKKWVDSNFTDKENREELFRLKVALELVSSQLDTYILRAENIINSNIDEDQE